MYNIIKNEACVFCYFALLSNHCHYMFVMFLSWNPMRNLHGRRNDVDVANQKKSWSYTGRACVCVQCSNHDDCLHMSKLFMRMCI